MSRPATEKSVPAAECRPCLERLVAATLDGCRAEGGRVDDDLSRRMRALVDEGLTAAETPAVIATRFLALARRRSGVEDPFAAKKKADFAAGQKAADGLGHPPADFGQAARAAILGNAFDHFMVADQGRIWARGLEMDLGLDHLTRAGQRLRPGGLVVILADNCGEQAFDRMLAGHLMGRGIRVAYVVKSAPAQNDLTLADLRRRRQGHGLGMVVGSGTDQVGLDPGQVPAELARLLDAADLVIAKGMGHYETMAPQAGLWPGGRVRWPLLMLFLAKCIPVSRSLGLEPGSGAALFLNRG